MGDTELFNYCTLLVLINLVFSSSVAKSEVFTVGDEEKWSTTTNYLTWSQKYNFSVGDVLVFNYNKVQHNAYEVTQGTYQSCDTSTGVLAKYDSGNDEIELTEAKKYWFICDKEGHCLGGMRFAIDVKQSGSSSNPDNNNSTDTNPTPDFDKNYASSSKGTMIYLVSLGGALLCFLFMR